MASGGMPPEIFDANDLDIADDVLEAAKAIAREQRKTRRGALTVTSHLGALNYTRGLSEQSHGPRDER